MADVFDMPKSLSVSTAQETQETPPAGSHMVQLGVCMRNAISADEVQALKDLGVTSVTDEWTEELTHVLVSSMDSSEAQLAIQHAQH